MKMNIAKEMLRYNIQGQIEGKEIQPLILCGAPGIAKTRSTEAVVKELGYEFINISLPSLSSEELSGLPTFTKAPHMNKYSLTNSNNAEATEWTAANLILEANTLAEKGKGCVVMLDDLHRLNLSVSPYMYQMLEERALGLYKFADNVALVGSMNTSDEAGFTGLDSPIKDRAVLLQVEFDFDSWYASHGKYLNYLVASFIKLHTQYIQEQESTGIEQFLTPRSCTYFGNELDLYPKEFILANAKDLAEGRMSKTASVAFAKHVEYLNKIDFSGIVKERRLVDIDSLTPIDAILYAYIINYIETKADAEYLVQLIEKNINEASFLGFLSGELYTKFEIRESGKKVTTGVNHLIEAVIHSETAEVKIPSHKEFFKYIIEFF